MNNETDNGSTLFAQECITSLNKQSPFKEGGQPPSVSFPRMHPYYSESIYKRLCPPKALQLQQILEKLCNA
jgi:hypothetical protein